MNDTTLTPPKTLFEATCEVVAREMQMDVEVLKRCPDRTKSLVLARHLVCCLMRDAGGVTHQEIATLFRQDPSTVISAIKRLRVSISSDPTKLAKYGSMLEEIKPFKPVFM